MSRNRNSTIEGIIDFTARFPWWVGVVIAVVSYFLLHAFAGREVVPSLDIAQTGQLIIAKLLVVGATVLQYLFPAAFLLGAAVSYIQQRKKERLYGNLRKLPALNQVKELSWQEFELLVGKHFEEKGYTVRQLSRPGSDGGVDLVATKDNEKYLVQCKQWRASRVGVKVVRELLGVVASSGAVGGFVVSSGQFTRDARVFANGTNIELIDGQDIVASAKESSGIERTDSVSYDQPNIPNCPKCGATMVKRTARKGANEGKQFWGCSVFPSCRGVRQL